MTVEHRIVAGLGDIRSISLECDKCVYRVTMPPEDVKELTYSCPHGHEWKWGKQEGEVITPLLGFASNLSKLRLLISQKTLGFHVLLEFDEPKVS